MADKEIKEEAQAQQDPVSDEQEQASNGRESKELEPVVSAKDLPKPSTSLDAPRRIALEKLRVALAAELPPITTLNEIEEINGRADFDSRTPLTTVLLAALEEAGGVMSLTDLAEKAAKLWNRPFPTSPYNKEEFIYLVVRNSDYMLLE